MTIESGSDDAARLAAFASIVGERYALRGETDVAPYVSERRGLYPGVTPLVLRPGSVDEVSRILRLATDTRTPIVPQGGNTGLVGGGMPDRSGREIVLSLSRLNRIRELDTTSNTVTAEAGVVLQALHDAVDAQGRLFPLSLASQGRARSAAICRPMPAVLRSCHTAIRANSVLASRSSCRPARSWTICASSRRTTPATISRTWFVGAEGTLGVITAAVLKLYPKPRGREVAMAGLASPEAALDLFNRALDRAGSSLTAFELIGARPMQFALRHVPGAIQPLEKAWPWFVLVEISSGHSAEDARSLVEEILGDGLDRGLIGDAAVAGSLAQFDAFWRLREGLSDAQRPEGASIKHDISVPVASIPVFIERAEQAVAQVCPQARVVCFGHMGDGNLHYNVSQPEGWAQEAFLALYRTMNKAVHDIVRDLGGSISAEHGIGQLKRDELAATAPPVALDLMRRIKAVFDPAGIMNPGKVI